MIISVCQQAEETSLTGRETFSSSCQNQFHINSKASENHNSNGKKTARKSDCSKNQELWSSSFRGLIRKSIKKLEPQKKIKVCPCFVVWNFKIIMGMHHLLIRIIAHEHPCLSQRACSSADGQFRPWKYNNNTSCLLAMALHTTSQPH